MKQEKKVSALLLLLQLACTWQERLKKKLGWENKGKKSLIVENRLNGVCVCVVVRISFGRIRNTKQSRIKQNQTIPPNTRTQYKQRGLIMVCWYNISWLYIQIQ